MSASPDTHQLVNVVALLGAAVVAIPIFRRLGLGSVLGYLAAGLAIGPFGLGWFAEPQVILHVAELGVVMFLFVIGLEMRPSHLWSLRNEIFGLGTLQIVVCGIVLTGLGVWLLGLRLPVAFIAAAGFVLTSTAVVMQLLAERGDLTLPAGQKIVSILLFEDLLIVPLLAVVALMAPAGMEVSAAERWKAIAVGAGSIIGLLAAGRWLLNPLFRILAQAGAREVMTAAALLVVLGAALLMQLGGLSMAMGAFLAGVLLSESTFRHQIEADIEPFRGILLGLFFLGVGMAMDLSVVASNWRFILLGVGVLMVGKAVCIYAVARVTGSDHHQALDRGVLMAQGGEFAFVLFAAAAVSGVVSAQVQASLTAIVVLSMALTPLFVLVQRRLTPAAVPSLEGVEAADGQSASVLVIGFGRFGQVASQALLARDVDVTIIDNDIDMIQSAAEFGFKIYYGDGTRLDVLRASGAETARAIAVCTDHKESTDRIVELVRDEFPQAKLLVRSYDREHSLGLIHAGVDFQIRETFESAVLFGSAALVELGVDVDEADLIASEIRKRDAERFELEMAGGGLMAGAAMIFGHQPGVPRPTPFTPPRRQSRTLNPDQVPVEPGPGPAS